MRQQLMKAEWPRGGRGTLDAALAALDSLITEVERLRAALDACEKLKGIDIDILNRAIGAALSGETEK